MTTRLNSALRNQLVDILPMHFNSGFLDIYAGVQVSFADDAATTTLLATIELPDPAFTRTDTGLIEKVGFWQTTAIASGRAGWARFRNAADDIRIDVGITPDELALDALDIVNGQPVEAVSFSFMMPGS